MAFFRLLLWLENWAKNASQTVSIYETFIIDIHANETKSFKNVLETILRVF